MFNTKILFGNKQDDKQEETAQILALAYTQVPLVI